jgi:hypothetical protein
MESEFERETVNYNNLSELEQLWAQGKVGLDIPQPQLKAVLKLIEQRHQADLKRARREELEWAKSQAPHLHPQSDQVDRWEAEQYMALLNEAIAALDNQKEE